MLNIAVFVSGGGTNLAALINAVNSGSIDAKIVLVVSSNHNAYALKRAADNNIPSVVISRKAYSSLDYNEFMIKRVRESRADLVVLAGYMGLISPEFIDAYRNRIINIHPSLIPSFCGKGYYGLMVHEAVLEKGVKITGATVHFVDESYDNGPIILQKPVAVLDDDTAETLQKRVMEEAEWLILPESVQLISHGKVQIIGNKVKVKQ
ncbi:MAG: phosphoribosylglycinamide formyltransferase [Clostridiales bacterium]|jgi:phosphoribosylglycinamide formyltransferase-1|nr:phosphoribosylglycinamide formyltransferase [Clostridiales bacterium]